MHVLSTLLSEEDGKFYFKDGLYTGVAYYLEADELGEFDSCRILRIDEVVGGEIVSTRDLAGETEWMAQGPSFGLYGSGEKPPKDPDYAYAFNRGILESFECRVADEFTTWHANGAIEKRQLGDDTQVWHEDCTLWTATHSGIYVAYSPGFTNSLDLKIGFEPKTLSRYPLTAGERLTLAGDGMVDSVLTQFSGLQNLTQLCLEKTRLTGKGLRAFLNSPLTRVSIKGSSLITDEEIQAFLAAKPECEFIDFRQFD